MATWIVHLRVAEALLGRFPNLAEMPFAIGNIAPDSGIPDEKWEHFNPPPEITHFQNPASPKRDLADLEFYRRYLLPLRGDSADLSQVAFNLGYFCHLVTDNLWSREVGRPTKTRFAAQFAADRSFIWEVKKDWYGLDFVYLRDHPDCLFWRSFLKTRVDSTGLDFLPLEALRQRVEYIQTYYQTLDDDVRAAYTRPYVYLSPAEMDAFVEQSANTLEKIFNQVWVEGKDTGAAASVLEIVA